MAKVLLSLQRAKLQGANLLEANLLGADLQGAKLQEAKLQGVNLRGAKVATSNLDEASDIHESWIRADFTDWKREKDTELWERLAQKYPHHLPKTETEAAPATTQSAPEAEAQIVLGHRDEGEV